MRIFVTFPQKNRQLILHKNPRVVYHPDWVKLVLMPDERYKDKKEVLKILNSLFGENMRSSYFEYDEREKNKKYYPLWIL